jgi:Ca2+-transporting ATPase
MNLMERGANEDAHLRFALEVAARASRQQPTQTNGTQTGAAHDPVDAAILRTAALLKIDDAQARHTIGLVPFSSERKLMAVFDAVDGVPVAYVKGAPGRLIDLSDRVLTRRGEEPLDERGRARLREVNQGLAGGGLRVLAVAYGSVAEPAESKLERLTFVGFLGFMDPPAVGVRSTIAQLRAAGLRTVMITGDQRRTAEAVGRELGLLSSGDQVLDGRELSLLSSADLRPRLADMGAFSRVTPEDKLVIVGELQARGEIVAMLGDGVNDAAALKKADVGVAMGVRGTDVAKEAAAIVLQDDRFETIAAAVEEGRVIYDNIRKFVFYLFSCNLAEILVLLVAGLANLPTPLFPLQILWVNIVTDTFPALALAMEPGDADVMRRPPRKPQEAILSRAFLKQIGLYACLITVSTLGLFLWALPHAPAQAVTMGFMTLALAQVFHLGNARSHQPVVRPVRAFANRYAVGAVVVSVLLQIASVQLAPLRSLLRVASLDVRQWLVVFAFSSVPAVVGQAIRSAAPHSH